MNPGVTAQTNPTICMVVHAYYPLAEPRVQREARAACQAGYDVIVVALRSPGEAAREVIDGVRVHRLPLVHRRGAGMLRMALEYLSFSILAMAWVARESLLRPFALVHVHAPPDFLVVAALPARLRGTRVVLDIHDLSSHMLAVRTRGEFATASKGLLAIERRAAGAADRVVTVHEPYRGELIAHGVPAEKVRIIMNGADDSLLTGIRPSMRDPEHRFRLAYHGTLTWWYGTDLIIDAVRKLNDLELDVEALILGDGDALLDLQTTARQLGVGDRVEFSRGYLPIENALARVATADCGVIPNRPSVINRFALSSKLLEYVSLRVPVVVAELETLAAHFSPEEVTFFTPGDSESMANAIRWVHDHRAEARAKAARALERAEEYSWNRGRRQLLALYEDLLQSHRLAPAAASRVELEPHT